MPPNPLPKVLVDADVVSHFLTGNRMALLNVVFPGRLALLTQVEDELRVVRKFNTTLDNFIRFCQVEQIALPDNDLALALEYAMLQRTFGKGESACMALARHHAHYIASSNLRDIRAYCEQYSIKYYTTSDILHLAVIGQHLTIPECNEFIAEVRAAGGKMPYATYQQFKQANGL
ncbi:hypothetical protein GCM10023172_01720 [Hymenobacter ginsengisoli]|uniref:PIN domain-containing protein n=1 Tax=Hymenobacter ginsengisoli TaxID=1051626 RepID=A0ABP8PUA1_9BACT|nr:MULTISPECIES: hypothetical protein [unclassified Hymenobacter]MBO2033566.1 hypothetical protein [Hymenobacter sp. BT559]